jgi:hypothetical protein
MSEVWLSYRLHGVLGRRLVKSGDELTICDGPFENAVFEFAEPFEKTCKAFQVGRFCGE